MDGMNIDGWIRWNADLDMRGDMREELFEQGDVVHLLFMQPSARDFVADASDTWEDLVLRRVECDPYERLGSFKTESFNIEDVRMIRR